MNAPRRRKVSHLTILSTGSVVLFASVAVFLLILKSVYGRYELSDIVPTEETLRSMLATDRIPVAILSSQYSQRVLEEGSTWLHDNVSAWERFTASMDLGSDVIDDQAVESGELHRYKLVVLPGTKSMSEKETREVKKYVEGGGSIFATSGTASYTEDGQWRGWTFLSEVFGLQFTKEITPDEAIKTHTLRGGLPITAGIPTGYSLRIATWDRPMACEVLEPRTTQASFWYNFRNDSGLVREALEKTAGIVYGTYGKGRFVWMGFELNSVLGNQEDYIYFDRLCKQSVEWLTYSPSVVVRDWPSQYRAAAMIVPCLTREISNVEHLLAVVKSENVPATFFVDPSTVQRNPSMIRALASFGDVGAIVDLGYPLSTEEEGNRFYDLKTQLEQCSQATTALEQYASVNASGLLPLHGMYDENSIRSLIASGYDYLVTDSLADRAVPRTLIRGTKALVSFNKTARDDREVIDEYGLTDTDYQLYTYKEDIDRVLFQGGMYLLRIHTDLQCRPEHVSVVREIVRYLKNKHFWIATASGLKEWWMVKSALEVDAEVRSNRRIALVISNPADIAVRNAVVEIGLNKEVRNLEITSDIIGMSVPPFRHDPRRQVVEVTIPVLDSGESLSFFVDYDNVDN